MKIKFETRNLKKLSSDLADVSRASEKAVTRAINKTLAGVRTDTVKEIRDEVTLKAAYIRKTMSTKRATRSRQVGKVRSRGRRVGLINYRARQTARGVKAQIEKHGKRNLYEFAFIAQGRGSGFKVFRRDFYGDYFGPRKSKQKNIPWAKLDEKYRYKIGRLTGPSVPGIMGKERILERIDKKAGERMERNIKHEMDWELKRQNL